KTIRRRIILYLTGHLFHRMNFRLRKASSNNRTMPYLKQKTPSWKVDATVAIASHDRTKPMFRTYQHPNPCEDALFSARHSLGLLPRASKRPPKWRLVSG